jgi:Putative auto-transporter adhesin, head GIN domain
MGKGGVALLNLFVPPPEITHSGDFLRDCGVAGISYRSRANDSHVQGDHWTDFGLTGATHIDCDCLRKKSTGVYASDSGKKASETREVDDFTQLELRGVGRIEVTIGNRQPLELSGDDNILPVIETKVADGKLVIDTMRSIRPVQPLIIKATASDLTAVTLGGAGEIAVSGITNVGLNTKMSGP